MTVTDVTDLLKVFISWPVLAGVFLFVFRSQVATLLLGIRRVSPQGIDIAPQDQRAQTNEARRLSATVGAATAEATAQATTRPSGREEDPAEQLMRAFDSPVLVEQERRITHDLEGRGVAGDQAVRVLTRHLAAFQMGYAFEWLYSILWGSQLAILQYLATTTTPVAVEQVRPFYTAAAQRYPAVFASYPFENYIGFLRAAGVVNLSNSTIVITPLGREFLGYIVRMGKPIAKSQ